MPRKNNAKYQRRFCKVVFEHFENGGCMDSLSSHLYRKLGIKVCRKTVYNWAKQHPEFALEIDLGKSDYKRQLSYLLKADMVNQALKDGKKINNKSLHFAIKQNGGASKNSESEEIGEDNRIVIVRAKDAD